MADRTKKRKRPTDGSSQPSKKAAIEGASKNVKILVHEADKWAPIVALTPGVAMPTSISLKPYTKQRGNPPQRPGQSGAIATTELLLHSSAHPSLDYTAREEEAGGTDALLKHYVGVYNPETGKLEVMEARKMVVRGSVRAQQASEEEEISTNMWEARNNLGQAFGTKKARKAISSRTENAIAPDKSARLEANSGKLGKLDSASTATLATMKEATAGMSTREELAAAADASKPRPKANVNAEEVKDVYTLDSLIGHEVLESIPVREWENAVKGKKEIVVNFRFVARRIQKLADIPSKLKALRYILCLLDFYTSAKPMKGMRIIPKRKDLRNSLGDIPESVQENIRRRFSKGGEISKFQGHLLITHVCALACVVDNFEVDIFELAEDFKLEMKEMGTYFREIGARIVPVPEAQRKALNLDKAAATQRKFAKLRLPLDFPKVNFARGRPK